MSEDIIIYPNGDFSNKIVCLMAAIDLQLKTKKEIKIVYSLSYNDLIWDSDLSFFIDDNSTFGRDSFILILFKFPLVLLFIFLY